jgi:hypothetical protein
MLPDDEEILLTGQPLINFPEEAAAPAMGGGEDLRENKRGPIHDDSVSRNSIYGFSGPRFVT